MVKKSKRKQDIRSKLVAAVAMLMVATIMMVSSTYAWFTLSTAPEVQGITTTVGSNGSLEIALAQPDGSKTVSNATMEQGASADWTIKNLTWGNMLDMSDSRYNLANLTLLPSQLMVGAKAGGGYEMINSPLATPDYGSDGRIQGLLENTMIGGLKDGFTGYYENGNYGVRAVGTSNNMSEQALVFKNNLAAIKTHASKAAVAASRSLDENGSALATIMVRHASGNDTSYAEFVPALQALTADLNTSVNELVEMLRSGLLISITPIADIDTFNTLRGKIDAANVLTIQSVITEIKATQGVTIPAGFDDAAAKVVAVYGTVSDAVLAANALDANGTVGWTEVSGVMSNLMNVGGDITVSGKTMDEIQTNKDDINFLLQLATNCQIVLGAGSGVYYDIAEISGNFNATVSATLTGTFQGKEQTVEIKDALIRTNYVGETKADALYAGASLVQANGGSAANVVNVNYGYIVDFLFRTNASGANLLLQTEGKQRVYSDSENPATAGKGSVFTFETTDPTRVDEIQRLLRSIHVVFFGTDDGTVYGVAGVTAVNSALANGTYTITGTLELCNYYPADNGRVTVSNDAKASNALCALGQNTVEAVSAMVYLDGNNVTNADVLNDTNVTGALNLQFASSVDLVPMENTALRTEGTEVKYDVTLNVGAAQLEKKEDFVTQGANYSVDLDEVSGVDVTKIASVSVTMGGQTVADAWNETEHTITITNVTGDIVVTVTLNNT